MTAAELSEEARRRADVRRVRVRVGSTLAAAAVIGLAWWSTASEDALVPRGVEPAASLSLDWLVEGDGLRRVGAEPVAPDESIIFRVRATRAGYVCLDEEVDGELRRIFPIADGAWPVEVGVSLLGRDGVVQAYRSDFGPGSRRVRAVFDPKFEDCRRPVAHADKVVVWDP